MHHVAYSRSRTRCQWGYIWGMVLRCDLVSHFLTEIWDRRCWHQKSWHFLSHFQSENGNNGYRYSKREVFRSNSLNITSAIHRPWKWHPILLWRSTIGPLIRSYSFTAINLEGFDVTWSEIQIECSFLHSHICELASLVILLNAFYVRCKSAVILNIVY